MGRVQAGEMTLRAAAQQMGVCYRQAKRIASRWRNQGAWGLVHAGRERISRRRLPQEDRRRALEVYEARYGDFGPTLAVEYLAKEEKIVVSRETLRRWLVAACLWQPRRRRCRRQRPRRERFGQLVQLDGSLHRWLEDRDDPSCLMVMVDDATNHTETFLARGETLEAAFAVLRRWIERHGVPEALYLDRRNIYVGNDGSQRTDFARACRELGIRLVVARSPQAKGRVERRNGMLQDRLVKHLRLAGACTIDEANAMAEPGMEHINNLFHVEPASAVDAHRRAPPPGVLAEILCRQERRKVDRDGTISIASRRWRLEPPPPPGSHVSLRRVGQDRFVVHQGRRRLQCLEGFR
jgi:transposase